MSLDEKYKSLLEKILVCGSDRSDRTGAGTLSLFGEHLEHDMTEGFPLLTTKKVHFKSIDSELRWFLSGATDLRSLLEKNNTIWVGDAYERYKKHNSSGSILNRISFMETIMSEDDFNLKWGDLGPIYGHQWRNWKSYEGSESIDQVRNVLDSLRNNPYSRRHIVSAWNVGDLGDMVLPPCHYSFQFYVDDFTLDEKLEIIKTYNVSFTTVDEVDTYWESLKLPKNKLSLMWNQRSCDTFLGLPFNIASYALLLEMVAVKVNMMPYKLKCSLGDVHLYKNHIDQAKKQMKRTPRDLPSIWVTNTSVEDKDFYNFDKMEAMLLRYDPHPTIKAPLNN